MVDLESNKRNDLGGEASGELDFLELIRVLAANWILIVSVTAVVLVGAGVVAFTTTPVYRAEVLLAPADDMATSGGGLSSIMSRLGSIPGLGAMSRLGRQDKVAQGIITLQSQKFIMEFIDDNNLLPVLFAGKWDAEKEEWAVDSPDDIPTLADGFLLFDKTIVDIAEQDSGIVALSIEWSDPEQAALWANSLVERLNGKLRLRAIEEADKTISILNEEVEKTRIVELRQAIFFMIENQVNVRTMASVRDEFAFKIISPAIAPEEERFVSPNRPFIFAVAAVVGPLLGVFLSFFIFSIRRISSRLSKE